jgi:hypothetical protein
MRKTIGFGLLGVALAFVALALLPSNASWRSAGATRIDAEALGARSPSASAPPEPLPRVAAARDAPKTLRVADDAAVVEADDVPPSSIAPSTPVDRIDELAAGLGRIRAEEIVSREAELHRTAVSRQYASTGTVYALTGSAQLEGEAALRAELGEADFERYLEALGRPTRVAVAGVAAESAAANAGVLRGDEIRSYGGQRVFNLRELNELSQRRALGETVPVEILRDGIALHVYVTGGPLGLTPTELR